MLHVDLSVLDARITESGTQETCWHQNMCAWPARTKRKGVRPKLIIGTVLHNYDLLKWGTLDLNLSSAPFFSSCVTSGNYLITSTFNTVVPSLFTVSHSEVSVTHSQPQSTNIKWKILEINKLQVVLSEVMNSHMSNCIPLRTYPLSTHCVRSLLTSHLAAIYVIRLTAVVLPQCFHSSNPYFT